MEVGEQCVADTHQPERGQVLVGLEWLARRLRQSGAAQEQRADHAQRALLQHKQSIHVRIQ